MSGLRCDPRGQLGGADETECVRARPLLGTIVEIAARGPSAGPAVQAAFRAVAEVHRLMSYHDPRSDVSRINRTAASRSVAVSPHTWRVLRAARSLAEASDGLFDITVAPTLNALGFLPRHSDFPRASPGANWRDVELLPEFRVRLARPARLDLGGIAKGYAVDRAIDVLRSHRMRAARVNGGGDLRVLGGEPGAVGVRVRVHLRVRRPSAPTELWPLTEISAGAAATSADTFSARRVRGRWVTPLIHPHTRATSPPGRSVTVLAADCLTADALTKVVHADPLRASAVLTACSARALVLEESGGIRRVSAFDRAHASDWQRWRMIGGRYVDDPPSSSRVRHR